jgi:hypothetical protein
MKTQITTTENNDLNIAEECSTFGVHLGVIVCTIVGIWGLACFLGALFSAGPVEMIRGYITAITGV